MEVKTKLEVGQPRHWGGHFRSYLQPRSWGGQQPRHWGGHFRSYLQPRSWGGDLRDQPQDNQVAEVESRSQSTKV